MVSELDSGLSDPGSSPGQGHCVVFYTMIRISYIIKTNMTTIQHMFQTFQETRLTRPLNRILSPQFFLVKGDGRCTRTTHLCNLEITRDSSLHSTWSNYNMLFWYLGAGMKLGDDIASTQLKNWVAKGANPYSSRSFTQNVLTYGDSISKQFECTLAIWKNQRFHKLIPIWNSWDLRERPFLSNIIWIRHLELPSSLYLKCSQF